MHNGCTTAFEATISKKPLLTYLPYEQKYGNELPNRLGYIVKTPEELLNKINEIFFDTHKNSKNNSNNLIPHFVSNKIFLDENELAANKIIKNWEILKNEKGYKKSNWSNFKLFLKVLKFRQKLIENSKKFFHLSLGIIKIITNLMH